MASPRPQARPLLKRARGASRGAAGYAVVTDEGLAEVENWAQSGLPLAHIAKNLGVDRHTLADIRKRQPAVDEAIARGRATVERILSAVLFRQATEGNTVACMFLLKCLAGWREGSERDSAQVVNNIQVNLQSMTTGEVRQRLAALMDQRERLLGGDDEGGDG